MILENEDFDRALENIGDYRWIALPVPLE